MATSTEKLGLLYSELERLRTRIHPTRVPRPVISKTLAMDGEDFRFARELHPLLGRVRNAIVRRVSTVLHLTSAVRGEGVSTVAREFAAAAAAMPGCRPLLLDCNQGEFDQSAALGAALPGVVGSFMTRGQVEVAAVVAGGAIFHAAEFDVASFDSFTFHANDAVPAAEAGGAPKGARTMPNLYRALCGAYNLIIVDCPPVPEAPYFAPLAQDTPDVLLVVEGEKTRISAVIRAKDEIPALGGRLIGVIMNRRRIYIPRFIDCRL